MTISDELEQVDIPRPSRGIFVRDDPIVDERTGMLVRGGMWPSQRKWWELENFVRLFVGGYGSGKTIQLCKRHIELALANAPIPTAIVSPTYNMAKETVFVTLEELLSQQAKIQKHLGGHLSYEVGRSTPYEFRITHQGYSIKHGKREAVRRGRILIYSGEHPDKLKGTNLSSAGIDEPFIQDLAVFEQMVVRVRHRSARKVEVNLTGTPEQLNWGYDLAEGDLRDQYDVGIVQASTVENKALTEQYVARLMSGLDAKAQQAYLHGQFINMAKGLVYYAFNRMDNVVDLEMPSGAILGAGMDFNVNPMTAIVFWRTTGSTPHFHVFDEIELPNSDTPEMCAILRERYGQTGYRLAVSKPGDFVDVKAPLEEVYPDPHAGRSTSSAGGKTDYRHIEEAGFEVVKVPHIQNRRDRFNAANGMLRPVGNRVRMTVAPRCKKLIKYMMTYAHELLHKDSQKAMSHLLDATTYPVAYLYGTDRNQMRQRRLIGA